MAGARVEGDHEEQERAEADQRARRRRELIEDRARAASVRRRRAVVLRLPSSLPAPDRRDRRR